MTDEELIAEARRIGPRYRGSSRVHDQHAGWLLKELADRLEGRAAAQVTGALMLAEFETRPGTEESDG